MKNVLFLLTMLVSLIANAYEPMIREDRVWEFGEGSSDELSHVGGIIIKYRFSGTETKNGIKYNVLNIMREDGSLEPVALMREDVKNQSIYLYCGQEYLTVCSANRELNIDLGKNQEILLYSLPPEYLEIYEYSDIMPYGYVSGINDINSKQYDLALLNLVHKETLDYLDTQRKFYCYRPYNRFENSFECSDSEYTKQVMKGYYLVEGVGNVGYGTPYLPSRADIITGESTPQLPYRFMRLTDPWGKTVFDARWIFGGSDIE